MANEGSNPLADLERSLKPYKDTYVPHTRIPEHGVDRQTVLEQMREMNAAEAPKWEEGYVSGAVYQGDRDHIDFLSEVYKLNSQNNPLHVDIWPSALRYESEIVAMTAHMLGADSTGAEPSSPDAVCGTLSSGGTESILLAMKAYRDRARDKYGIEAPQMVVPTTAHAAFDKAAHYFGIDIVHVPVDDKSRADVTATEKAITDDTIVLVGSSPSFPHGIVDPIEELSELARSRGIGFHTDACLGGFLLPWARQLGHEVPPFDFALPGVTSMSADTHKFGFAAKGTSVVLYRGRELRHYQYFTLTDWPGGLYCSPSFPGSRPGALSATAWAAMVSIGENGYLDYTKQILQAAEVIKAGIADIAELEAIGDPLFAIAFRADEVDVFKVMDRMTERGWSLNGLHKPPAVHICVTLRHAQPGVPERFVEDLRASVAEVIEHPEAEGTMAPIYGMAAQIPDRNVVADFMKTYMDLWYQT